MLARPPSGGKILELPSEDPSTASSIGYSQSKWVTEQICRRASTSTSLTGRVHVLRVGQLCGDTVTGRWNEKEGWPLLIRTAQVVGCLPILPEVGAWVLVYRSELMYTAKEDDTDELVASGRQRGSSHVSVVSPLPLLPS